MAKDDPADLKRLPKELSEEPIHSLEEDFFEYDEAARRLADHLKAVHPGPASGKSRGARSFIISIEGPWGSGKTSFVNLVVNKICGDSKDPAEPLRVDFNIWQSGSMNLTPWQALAYRLGESFYTSFHRECQNRSRIWRKIDIGDPERRSDRSTIPVRLDRWLWPRSRHFTDRRLHWLEIARRLSDRVPRGKWSRCLKAFANSAPSRLAGRGLDFRTGWKVLAEILGGFGSLFLGQPQSALRAAIDASKTLGENRLIEGPDWGMDTLEFVRDLNDLLYLLRPKPPSWRAVLVIDDVTRLDAGELPGVLDALGYMRELEDVLVILNLNPRVIAQLSMARKQDGMEANTVKASPSADIDIRRASSFAGEDGEETPLTRLLNVRCSVPLPPRQEARSMMEHYFAGLEFLPPGRAAEAARHLRPRTPRQAKHAAHWLYLRHGILPREVSSHLLVFLLDLFLFEEGQLFEEEELEDLVSRSRLLLDLKAQPWDMGTWPDHEADRPLKLWKDWPGALELIESIRAYRLAVRLSGLREEETSWIWTKARQRGEKALSSLHEELSHDKLVGLLDASLLETPESYAAFLLNSLPEESMQRLQSAAQLIGAAEGHFSGEEPTGLPITPEEIEEDSPFLDVLKKAFYNVNLLFALVRTVPAGSRRWIQLWMTICVVAPKLAKKCEREYTRLSDSLAGKIAIGIRDSLMGVSEDVALHTQGKDNDKKP